MYSVWASQVVVVRHSVVCDVTPCCPVKAVSDKDVASIFRIKEEAELSNWQTGFLLDLFFDPEDEGDIFLQKIVRLFCWTAWQ
jgi:hypothetical protein